MERIFRLQSLCYISLKFLIKNSLKKKFSLSLKGPRKGTFSHVPQKRGLYGNRRPFSEPYLAYPSRSPIKEPFLQVRLRDAPCLYPSIFQSPRYTCPLPGSSLRTVIAVVSRRFSLSATSTPQHVCDQILAPKKDWTHNRNGYGREKIVGSSNECGC
jgi:hypothetical protein